MSDKYPIVNTQILLNIFPQCHQPSAAQIPTVILSHMSPWDHPFILL